MTTREWFRVLRFTEPLPPELAAVRERMVQDLVTRDLRVLVTIGPGVRLAVLPEEAEDVERIGRRMVFPESAEARWLRYVKEWEVDG